MVIGHGDTALVCACCCSSGLSLLPHLPSAGCRLGLSSLPLDSGQAIFLRWTLACLGVPSQGSSMAG